MGAIVSAPRHRRPASASAPCQRPLVREDRPASAPPSLILSADRAVDVARRREALQRVDEAQAERARATQDEGNAARFTRAISPQQAMQLDRMVGEALVDQVLHEGQDVLTSLINDDAAAVLEVVGRSDGPLSGMLRIQASSHGIDLSATQSTPSLSRPRSSVVSTSRSAESEDEEAERLRARTLKRGTSGMEEMRKRLPSGKSDASNADEKQLEESLVRSGVLEMEAEAKQRMSADVLAHFARDRSKTVNQAKDALLARLTRKSDVPEKEPQTDEATDREEEGANQEWDAASSAPSVTSRRPPGEDYWNEERPSSQHRVLLDPLTPSELEEADAMVADIMQEAADLMSQLPEQHVGGVLEGVQRGRSPVAELFREHLAQREQSRAEDDLAACEGALDEILREGEALLQRLPDSDALTLLQVIDYTPDYTPRAGAQNGTHAHTSNNNAVVNAIRAHARQAEDDALLQAEAMLASEGLIDSILDAAVVSDDIEAILQEGQTLLEQLPDSAAKEVLENIQRAASPVAELLRTASFSPDMMHSHMSLRLGAVVPYPPAGEKARPTPAEEADGVEEPSVMNSGRAALLEMLEESDKLLGALPSPHARSLLHVLETAETPLSGAIRNPHAAAAAFVAAAAARAGGSGASGGAAGAGSAAHADSSEAAGADAAADVAEAIGGVEEGAPAAGEDVPRDTVGRIEIEDGLARFERRAGSGQGSRVVTARDAMGRPVLEDGLMRRYLGDDGLSRRWLHSGGELIWREAEALSEGDEDEQLEQFTEVRPSTVDSWAQVHADHKDRGTQHTLVWEDAETQMPSRPTSAQLEREWHLISAAEVAEALDAEADAIIAGVCEDLVARLEEQEAMEASVAAGEAMRAIVAERRVVSARTHRDDPTFVKEYNDKKAEEARVEAEQVAAEEKEKQWAAEREALEAALLQREQEVLELRSYLDKLPVVKVTETVDRTTGKLVEDPKYEYSRIPLEEEMAVHLQEEAERAFQRTIEAEMAAEQARRAAAEEAFRFEAAKAEVRLEAFRLQQRLEAEQQRAEREGDSASKVNPKRGAEPELKEGWVSVKRDGLSGGLQRRMYVLRNTAILTFADEARRGGCLNAMGLERIESFCKGQGNTLEIHPRDGNAIILHCGGLQARDQWLIAFESALKNFRKTYVAQPALPSPASKAKRELGKDSWDSAIEEKLRREVEARRDAVSKARMEQARADKLLDDARAQHQRLDRELRLRSRYPDISDDFIACLPAPEERRQVGIGDGGGGGGGVSVKDMENAIAASKKKAEEEHRRALQQVQDTWQRKVKETEKKVFELDKELMSYKEMSFKDTGITDLEDMYGGDNVKDQAAADAANFGGTLYGDGMMVVPQDWERLGTAGTKTGLDLDLSRPVTTMDDGNIHVFVDGDQAVLLNKTLDGTTVTALGGDAEADDVGRARKEGFV